MHGLRHLSSGSSHSCGAASYTAASPDSSAARSSLSASRLPAAGGSAWSARRTDVLISSSISSLRRAPYAEVASPWCGVHLMQKLWAEAAGQPPCCCVQQQRVSPQLQRQEGGICNKLEAPAGRRVQQQHQQLVRGRGVQLTLRRVVVRKRHRPEHPGIQPLYSARLRSLAHRFRRAVYVTVAQTSVLIYGCGPGVFGRTRVQLPGSLAARTAQRAAKAKQQSRILHSAAAMNRVMHHWRTGASIHGKLPDCTATLAILAEMATLGSLGAALRQQQAPGQARRRYRAAQPLRRRRPLQPPCEFGVTRERRCRVGHA